jgi:multisubunit Na+/H+ antiporter MnhB subunit
MLGRPARERVSDFEMKGERLMEIPDVARRSQGTARRAQHSESLTMLVKVGLIAYGIVHLLIAWLALQVTWTHEKKNTGNIGAVHTLATQPFGTPLLWISAIGFIALAAWQALEAAVGHEKNDKKEKIFKRIVSGGRVVLYLGLAVLFIRAATGTSGGKSKQAWTAKLLDNTGGQLIVALVGLTIIGIGIGLVYVAFKKTFKKRIGDEVLQGGSGDIIVKLGQVGYVAKGIALGVIGSLFVWAAVTYDPKKAGGLDRALKTVLDQPFGQVLLTIVALGFACFGVFCFAWARSPQSR